MTCLVRLAFLGIGTDSKFYKPLFTLFLNSCIFSCSFVLCDALFSVRLLASSARLIRLPTTRSKPPETHFCQSLFASTVSNGLSDLGPPKSTQRCLDEICNVKCSELGGVAATSAVVIKHKPRLLSCDETTTLGVTTSSKTRLVRLTGAECPANQSVASLSRTSFHSVHYSVTAFRQPYTRSVPSVSLFIFLLYSVL